MKKVLGFIVTLGLLVLVAACSTNVYTVTFDSNGGSTVAAMTVNENEKITQPANPTLLGSAFAGWYADVDLTDAWDFDSDVVTADLTLYAKWSQAIVTFSGVDDVTVEFDSDFDLLDGVSAVGNDGVDYTDYVTFSTIAHLDSEDSNKLDTTYQGESKINYKVVVENNTIGQVWRTITVEAPEAVEGEMLINGDFSNGIAGWNDTTINYIADGAAMDLSNDNGTLKVDVVAGWNLWTPRFGQAGVTIENGKTYEVSFRAKASVEKKINLQVGELLSSDPYFTDFKPGNSVTRTITTEWADYSYKFTMNLETNENGAVLFELGTFAGEDGVSGTLWFDDIVVAEATADADVLAPELTGINTSKTILVGGTFDPLAGVTAVDANDGDVTANIEVEILDANDDVVATVDTSVVGSYTINYSVEDAAGNESTASATLEVIEMPFEDENLIVNGDFDSALSDPAEWITWAQDWGTAPVTTFTFDDTNGVFTADIAGGGDAAWGVQVYQEGVTLEEGHTYRIVVTAKASVARDINIAIGEPLADNGWDEYARFDGVSLATDYTTQEFVFTVTKATNENIKVNFEIGNTTNFADGMITFDAIGLNEASIGLEINSHDSASLNAFELFTEAGDSMSINADSLTVTVNTVGAEAYAPHVFQLVDGLRAGTYTLKLIVNSSVARDLRANVVVPDWGFTSILPDTMLDYATNGSDATVVTVTFTVESEITSQVKLELDFGNLGEGYTSNLGTFTVEEVLLYQVFS